MKIIINTCYGGFTLSDAVYEKLIEYGIPVQAHIEQKRDQKTGLYLKEPLNEGKVIFDRDLDQYTPSSKEAKFAESVRRMCGRYWTSWGHDEERIDPLVIRAVEELGSEAASGSHAKLKIVEIPDDMGWEISEYDGIEHVAQKHQTWS